MDWNLDTDKPIYLQLAEQIKFNILSGFYKKGEKIPAVRDMAKEAGVNPNTMQRALTYLENGGLIYSKRTSGRYVSDDKKLIEELKRDLAVKQIKLFFDSMRNIGFSEKQALNLAENFIKEMDEVWYLFYNVMRFLSLMVENMH